MPAPTTPGSRRGWLRALFGIVSATVVALAALYAAGPWSAGPWSAETGGPAGQPIPLAPPVAVAGQTVTILGTGDVLVHPELWDQARRDGRGGLDFGPMFDSVRPAISGADLALCHLESRLAPPGGPYAGAPRFSVPREIAKALKAAGYDGCSTSSDHSLDHGSDGVVRTLDALDQVQLGHSGTNRTADEARRPRLYAANGVRVAHLSYTKDLGTSTGPGTGPGTGTSTGTSPGPGASTGVRPAGPEWMVNLLDPKKVAADADAARRAGAEIVVVSAHWGTEYEHEPDLAQQTLARQISGLRNVDLVLGHHAHVVQPMESQAGKWIAYGLGNHLARHPEPINENREGVMVRVTFGRAAEPARWRVAAVEALPTFVDLNPDARVIDLERALADPATSPGRRRIYQAAVQRVQGHLLTRAADRAGLLVRGVPVP